MLLHHQYVTAIAKLNELAAVASWNNLRPSLPVQSTNYFWRVKALEVNGQNIPSDWSATFSMQTEPAPAPPAAPPAASPAEPATPLWVWVIIAIGAILVIVTLILVFKTRRV